MVRGLGTLAIFTVRFFSQHFFFWIVVWRFRGSIFTVWDCPLYSRGVGEGTRRRVVVMRLLWNWLWFDAGLGRTHGLRVMRL